MSLESYNIGQHTRFKLECFFQKNKKEELSMLWLKHSLNFERQYDCVLKNRHSRGSTFNFTTCTSMLLYQ